MTDQVQAHMKLKNPYHKSIKKHADINSSGQQSVDLTTQSIKNQSQMKILCIILV